jgi:hypothetical protein
MLMPITNTWTSMHFSRILRLSFYEELKLNFKIALGKRVERVNDCSVPLEAGIAYRCTSQWIIQRIP